MKVSTRMALLASAGFFNTLGRQLMAVAIGWELYQRTKSSLTLGLIGLFTFLPVVLFFAPAGAAADKLNRRWLAAGSAFSVGIGGTALAICSATAAPVWLYYVCCFWLGCTLAFHSPARAAVVTSLIEREHLARYNVIGSTAFEIASIGGPAAAGGLLAILEPWAVYAIVALTASLSVSCYALLPATKAVVANKRESWRVGVRFIFSSPLLLSAITLDLFAVLFAGVTALLPAIAHDTLHTDSVGLGILRACPALGAVAMAAVLTRIAPWRRPGAVLLAVVAAYGLVTIFLGLTTSTVIACVLLAIGGALDNISVVIRITAEQMLVPDRIRGRVAAVHNVFIGMSNELGELQSGVCAHLVGLGPTIVGGGVVAVVVVAVVRMRWPQLAQMPRLAELQPIDPPST